jgi:hypothetical protein
MGIIPHVPLKIRDCVPWGFRGWSRLEGPRERKTLARPTPQTSAIHWRIEALALFAHWLGESPTISVMSDFRYRWRSD